MHAVCIYSSGPLSCCIFVVFLLRGKVCNFRTKRSSLSWQYLSFCTVQHTGGRDASGTACQREEEMAEVSMHCEKQLLYSVQRCKGNIPWPFTILQTKESD